MALIRKPGYPAQQTQTLIVVIESSLRGCTLLIEYELPCFETNLICCCRDAEACSLLAERPVYLSA